MILEIMLSWWLNLHTLLNNEGEFDTWTLGHLWQRLGCPVVIIHERCEIIHSCTTSPAQPSSCDAPVLLIIQMEDNIIVSPIHTTHIPQYNSGSLIIETDIQTKYDLFQSHGLWNLQILNRKFLTYCVAEIGGHWYHEILLNIVYDKR